MITTCSNCGAPVHGSRCDYCGTDYPENRQEQLYMTPHMTVYTEPVHTIAATVSVPLEVMSKDSYNKELVMERVKGDLAYKLSLEALEYIDIETWLDPIEMKQFIGGRIKVARPEHRVEH